MVSDEPHIRGQYTLLLILIIVLLGIPQVPVMAQSFDTPFKSGPFVDQIVFKVIEGQAEAILALQNDEIDMVGDMIDPQYVGVLAESTDIETVRVRRNGFGFVTINTAKYPLSITALRRALAFAVDKQSISNDIWEGLADPQDGPLPVVNPWTIEGTLNYTYYEANVDKGNQLLDDAGFYIPEGETWRVAPNGDEFEINVECPMASDMAIQVGRKFADALIALHINGRSTPTVFDDYLTRLNIHGDYDMCFLGWNFETFDADVLGNEWWGENTDVPFMNFANWRNDSYDAWRDQLMYSTDYDLVKEASDAMQKIWVYECPWIVAYNNVEIGVYRIDRFEGHQNDISGGLVGFWTNYKVHLKESEGGPFGGVYRLSNPKKDVTAFNIIAALSVYSHNVLGMMYDGLLNMGPDGEDIFWLAESWTSETHADNSEVPDGHTRFTFNLIQNATWSDGTPLTAEDVAFSLNYLRDALGNRMSPELTEVSAAYAPTTYTLVVEFNTESYWHLHRVAYKPILPKHIFEEIGVDNWNTWWPTPPEDEMVTSGPFNVSEYIEGEFIELTRNENYFYRAERPGTSTTGSLTNTPLLDPFELLKNVNLVHWIVTLPSLMVIAIVLVKWKMGTDSLR
jgi:ABC-type transport system substrate-binding protein